MPVESRIAHNQAGSKVAASFAKARPGDVYHTGELTKANAKRAATRAARKEATQAPG